MREILEDLRAEQQSLEGFLLTLSPNQWSLMTPAEGWTVHDSVSHLAFIDDIALAVLKGDLSPLEGAKRVPGFNFNQIGLDKGRRMSPKEVIQWWRGAREATLQELASCDPKQRIPWFARPMGARSFATARLMETWAHGLDCYAAVGTEPQDTDRLRHVATLAYLARPYAYMVNGLEVPEEPLLLELVLPSGRLWTAGPEDSPQYIRGRAGEFCRVAVRRLHWKDTDLEVRGEEARRFLEIAQTYAGPPGRGRRPTRRK